MAGGKGNAAALIACTPKAVDTLEQREQRLNWSATVRENGTTVSRSDLLSLIKAVSRSAAMYQAMTSPGFASNSGCKGPIKLKGDPKGTSVLITAPGWADPILVRHRYEDHVKLSSPRKA
jgi:hypothetical protein